MNDDGPDRLAIGAVLLQRQLSKHG